MVPLLDTATMGYRTARSAKEPTLLLLVALLEAGVVGVGVGAGSSMRVMRDWRR